MPRRLLRDGKVVPDDWQTSSEGGGDSSGSIILTFDQWQSDRDRWVLHSGRLGVILAPAHPVELLVPDLARFALVGAEFPELRRGARLYAGAASARTLEVCRRVARHRPYSPRQSVLPGALRLQ